MNFPLTAEKVKSQEPISLLGADRDELRAYFENTWELYEVLFSSIKSYDTFFESPDPLRNPLIFYYGHTAAFYVNKLKAAGLISSGINSEYEDIFARGVDPEKADKLEVMDLWPGVDQVSRYRDDVYNLVIQIINEAEIPEMIDAKEPLWSLMMGIEHDRIHLETSSVLIRQLDVAKVTKPDSWEYAPSFGKGPDNKWISVQANYVEMGKKSSSNLFGWDNEYGSKAVSVGAFEATENLIRNKDFLEFHEEGYDQREYWTEEGWNWKSENSVGAPRFWVIDDETIKLRLMFDEIDLPLDWPVEVNVHEAEAYCKWIGGGTRLLTEAEFNVIGRKNKIQEPFEERNNVNLQFGSPTPVGFSTEPSAHGFNDLWGNVWDLLSDDFYPLNGFEPHEYYDDFSAPYFDSDHGMLLGGSWITTGTGASLDYRLWFRRHFYQHAGFRLARDKK